MKRYMTPKEQNTRNNKEIIKIKENPWSNKVNDRGSERMSFPNLYGQFLNVSLSRYLHVCDVSYMYTAKLR